MLPSRPLICWRSLNCYLIGWDRHLASINLKTDLIEIIKNHTCWGRKRLSSKSFLTFFLENETFYCELSFSVNYLFRLIDEMTSLYLFQILKLTFWCPNDFLLPDNKSNEAFFSKIFKPFGRIIAFNQWFFSWKILYCCCHSSRYKHNESYYLKNAGNSISMVSFDLMCSNLTHFDIRENLLGFIRTNPEFK